MHTIEETEAKKAIRDDTDAIQPFTETPPKTGKELPAGKPDAFDLFNFFTADIIRSKKEFTR
jgi:hypothetical protein